jgi:uncharacterized protein (TIGR02231 family)
MTATEKELIPTRVSHFPSLSEELLPIELPVREVTLLEDRAQIRRSGRVTLRPGRNRLVIRDVAPVLQDVSLRGAVAGDARVIDLCARRAVRVRAVDRPDRARQLEEEIEQLREQHEDLAEERGRAEQRHRALLDILAKGTAEIPEDAAWGMVNQQAWHDTFETLYKRARALVDTILERYHAQLEIVERVDRLAAERRAIDRWDHAFVAWIEVDLDAPAAGEHELSVEYVVPNALWRPLHTARLGADGRVRFRCCAAVWQNTGEDWQDVGLTFSTARASLGTEPPLLSDDLLRAQRKSERVVVEQRQVAVQRASVGGGQAAESSRAIDLPGVDDGGDIQNLRASSPSSIPSDGRLNVIPVFELETAADRQLICVPELEPRVFLKATLRNEARHPILAGPVELIRENGVVGWTKVLFVAPGEKLELSFGHDDALRIYRTTRGKSERDEVDQWTHNDTTVAVFLSNLEGEAKQIELVERIPVTEIEHVKVKILAEKCQPPPPLPDQDGFCRYRFEIPPNGHQTLQLRWRISTAPGVEGI